MPQAATGGSHLLSSAARSMRRVLDAERSQVDAGLAPGAVEREHQLALEALTQRMLVDQRLELGHQPGVPPVASLASILSSSAAAGHPRAA
jgi:hypothetical protein